MEVNLLDKICVLDAKTVTKKEFEQTLGMSREEYLKERECKQNCVKVKSFIIQVPQ